MKRRQAKAILTVLALSMAFGLSVPCPSTEVKAATEHWNDASEDSSGWTKWKENWDSYSGNYENVSLTPGTDESELNYAWYSHTEETPKVRISENEDMSDSETFRGTQELVKADADDADADAIQLDGTTYYSNKVTVDGLKENTTYYYKVLKNGEWSDTETYSTKSFSSFSFLYVGDPQIGASKGQTSSEGETMCYDKGQYTSDSSNWLAARNDSYNWNNILTQAYEDHSDVSFIASAGDQVNYSYAEREYAGYLGADVLKNLPVATTIGNHDSTSYQYTCHYNNPNSFSLTSSEDSAYTEGHTEAGSDYYYTYGDALFIVIDTNNYNCATHENVIKKAISENKDAKWRIVMFHQDIYGSGADHSASDGMVLRTQLTPIMDENDIDVVLQGHDHTYSRSYQLSGDGEDHTSFTSSKDEGFQDENAGCYIINSEQGSGTVVNPEGTVYMEANSSTGSKYYNLISTQQDFIAERSQTWTPSYSVISVDDRSFSITTYDGETGKELNGSSTYTIIKDDTTQTITGTDSYEKNVGDKPFSLDAAAEGKLSYSSDNEDVAIVSSTGRVSIIGEGTAKITVSAAATDKKEAAEKTVTIKVAKAADTSAGTGGTSDTKDSDTKTSDTQSSKPKKATLKSVVSKKTGQMKVKWKKDSSASGYQVVYASNKAFTKNVTTLTIKNKKTVSRTIKNLTKKKKIYVKVRSYKKVNGKKVYGAYSKIKAVRIK